jgi:transcriptional regulator with XRE-family HTH domain
MEFATIGSALSSRRKSLNIDQARAAAIIGMSRTTFSSYERDLQRPSAEVLPSLAQFLQISIEDILTLYGGTCIEALRPALERFLATHDDDPTGRRPASDAGSGAPTTAAFHPDDSKDPKAPTSGPVTFEAPPVTPTPASEEFEHRVPSAFEPEFSVAPAAAPRDSSVSIFANELSDVAPRGAELPSPSSDLDQRDPKAAKDKSGKKKKGKKGKRSK